MKLADLIVWHIEQAAELDREQGEEVWAKFHLEAAVLLTSLRDTLAFADEY
jgi:hypothetical protein